MKKTHFLRLTIIVMAACFIAGVAVAAFMYGANAERQASLGTLVLAFDAAAEGKTAAGDKLEIRDMASDKVISAALKKAGVSGNPEDIRKNLYIAGVYPTNMESRINTYNSPLSTKSTSGADFRVFHPTMFHVTLYQEGVPELSADQRTRLLGVLLDTYRETLGGRTEVTSLESREPKLLSGDFAKKALKTSLPFSAVGFAVCIILLIYKRSHS